MKSTDKIILLGVIITALWLSGLAWIQVTHIPIEYIGSTGTVTTIEQGIEVTTIHVSPHVSLIPVVGISLLGIGMVLSVVDARK